VLSELGVLLCLRGSQEEGLGALSRSIHWQNNTLEGYAKIRIATTDIIDRAAISLSETYFNWCTCWMELWGSSEKYLDLKPLKNALFAAERLLKLLKYPQDHLQEIEDLQSRIFSIYAAIQRNSNYKKSVIFHSQEIKNVSEVKRVKKIKLFKKKTT